MGIVILCSELRPTTDFEQGKTEIEKLRALERMRVVEVKWSKRCIWALLSLVLFIAIIIGATVLAKRH